MEELVKEWDRLAEKRQQDARRHEDNEMMQERLLSEAIAYGYCADRLRRKLAG